MLFLAAGIAIIILCLALQFFFAGVEMGAISCDRIRLRHRSEAGDARAAIIEDFLSNPRRLFGTTLVGVNVAVVLGSSVASALVSRYLHQPRMQTLITTLIMWPLVLFVGQVIPMTLFRRHADVLALRAAKPLRISYYLLYPLAAVTMVITRAVTRALTGKSRPLSLNVGRDELQSLFNEQSGGASRNLRKMMAEIFEFADAEVHEVMVPLVDVIALPHTASAKEACRHAQKAGHTHLPIYRDRIDNIVGVVGIWEALAVPDETPVADIMVSPLICPEAMPAEELLLALMRSRKHLAAVVDEYGGAAGIVTFKDLIEEVVGEIRDEHEKEDFTAARVGDSIVVDGRAKVDELNEEFQLDLPEGETYETIGGYLVDLLGRIPKARERVLFGDMTFIIEEATDRRVVRVRVRLPGMRRRKGDGPPSQPMD